MKTLHDGTQVPDDTPVDLRGGKLYLADTAEIANRQLRAQQLRNEIGYRDQRRAEYPEIGDQLDALWKALHALVKKRPVDMEMHGRIMAVKAKYPKPGAPPPQTEPEPPVDREPPAGPPADPPADPNPDPAPVDPPADPDPAPDGPADPPTEPTPPDPVDPDPVDPEPTPSDPATPDPAPTDPDPANPDPADPDPTPTT